MNPLSLVPTKVLIDEIATRYDSFIFGMELNKTKDSADLNFGYFGKSAFCNLLCDVIKDKIMFDFRRNLRQSLE